MYNHYAGEGYGIASLLCPIPFDVRWNEICLNQSSYNSFKDMQSLSNLTFLSVIANHYATSTTDHEWVIRHP